MTDEQAADARAGRARLGEREIVDAAIALVAVDGLASLTMRRLGAALDVEAMSLYRYFPSRHALLDAMVEFVVSEVATHPDSQWQDDDDWRDYLTRIAHGLRRMALAHPRVFPLVASHPTAAAWIRPPLRSLGWVDAFLRNLQDHHFPPPAAVAVYKRFTTFLLGHLLLEVAGLGLEFGGEGTPPDKPRDPDRADAHDARVAHGRRAAAAMSDTAPDAAEIVAADSTPRSIAEEPAVQAAEPEVASAADAQAAPTEAVKIDVDVPVVAAVVSTASVDLEAFPLVRADAGLLAEDTAARDFERALTALLDDVASLRRA